MPKMTRDRFVAGIDDLWRLAQDTLTAKGLVYGTVVALDAMGRQQIFMQVPDDGRVADRGAVVIPGPFTDHLDLIGERFREHKAVAALMYAEAWTVSNETYAETVRMGIDTHDHPMKDELLFTVGIWPREFVAKGHQAYISRDEQGHIVGLDRHEAIETGPTRLMISWLGDLLPHP